MCKVCGLRKGGRKPVDHTKCADIIKAKKPPEVSQSTKAGREKRIQKKYKQGKMKWPE